MSPDRWADLVLVGGCDAARSAAEEGVLAIVQIKCPETGKARGRLALPARPHGYSGS